MNGRDRWVPALFIYEKDMAPTDGEKRAGGGGGGGGKRHSPGYRGQPQGSTGRDEDEDAEKNDGSEAAAAARPAPQRDDDWTDVDGMSIEEVRSELRQLNASAADVNQTDLAVMKRLLRILRMGKFATDFERVRRANITEVDLREIEAAFKRAQERAEEANQRAVLSLAREHPGTEPPESYEMYTLEQQFARQMMRWQIEEYRGRNRELAELMRNLSLQMWMFQQLNSSRAPAVRATTGGQPAQTAEQKKVAKLRVTLLELLNKMTMWEDPVYDQLFEPVPSRRWQHGDSHFFDPRDRSAWRILVLTVLTQTWQFRQGGPPVVDGVSTLELAAQWMGIRGFAPDDWRAELAAMRARPTYVPSRTFFNFDLLDSQQLAALIELARKIQKSYKAWLDLYLGTKDARSGSGTSHLSKKGRNQDKEVLKEYERVMEELKERRLIGENPRSYGIDDIRLMSDRMYADHVDRVRRRISQYERAIEETYDKVKQLKKQRVEEHKTQSGDGTTTKLLELANEELLQLQQDQHQLCRTLRPADRVGLGCDDVEDLFTEDEGDDGEEGEEGGDDDDGNYDFQNAVDQSMRDEEGRKRGEGSSHANRDDSQ